MDFSAAHPNLLAVSLRLDHAAACADCIMFLNFLKV